MVMDCCYRVDALMLQLDDVVSECAVDYYQPPLVIRRAIYILGTIRRSMGPTDEEEKKRVAMMEYFLATMRQSRHWHHLRLIAGRWPRRWPTISIIPHLNHRVLDFACCSAHASDSVQPSDRQNKVAMLLDANLREGRKYTGWSEDMERVITKDAVETHYRPLAAGYVSWPTQKASVVSLYSAITTNFSLPPTST